MSNAGPARKSPLHPRAAAATVTDIMRPSLATAGQYDHVAAAAYLMKHAGTTALMVMDAQSGQPTGIITQADIARAIANGKDLNDGRVHAVMITRPAVTTTTSIRDAAAIMTARHLRHLPVAASNTRALPPRSNMSPQPMATRVPSGLNTTSFTRRS